MTQPRTATVPSTLPRLLKTLLLSNLLMVVGILGIALGLVGVGNWTVVACVAVVVLSTALYGIAALRQRPRVLITPEGFVFEKFFGREARRWEDIDGPFVVLKVGWNEVVAYKLTPASRARAGKKPTSWFSGHDAVVGASTLACSAGELAGLLNEHQKHHASADLPPPAEKLAEPGAAADGGRALGS